MNIPGIRVSTEGEPFDEQIVERRFGQCLFFHHQAQDVFMTKLMGAQWLAALVLIWSVTPISWDGSFGQSPVHLWVLTVLATLVAAVPVWLGLKQPGRAPTRHAFASGQMLMSALFIHISAGHTETHFHAFGSLAFLACYRSFGVLMTASGVWLSDHLLRGTFWPASLYGENLSPFWQPLEYAGWAAFETVVLCLFIRRSLQDLRQVAQRQITMEDLNHTMEEAVQERTVSLQESQLRLRSLFENSPLGLYYATPEGAIVQANPTLLAMLGHESLECLDAHDLDIHRIGREPEREHMFQRLESEGIVRGWDSTWNKADGSKLMVRESIRVIRDASGKVVNYQGAVEDLTDQLALEANYMQAQRVQAMGQLAGGVAHDFNNILTAILGYSDMILQSHPGSAADRNHVLEIKKAGERAASLTRQLLAFSRKEKPQVRVIQPDLAVVDMEKMIRRLVGENIEVVTRIDQPIAAVKADPGQLQQVLLNLVVNARDSMPEGGTLTIGVRNICLSTNLSTLHPDVPPGEYVLISVKDTGVGMSPEVQTRIFEPFFTTKQKGQGTGLGLPTCQRILQQENGHITLHSSPGIGTTFKVFLPKADSSAALSPVEGSVRARLERGNETVLLVEDEPMVLKLGSMLLRSLGYTVYEATNGREALEKLRELEDTKIDLLVTDVVMPEMGGSELVQRVREQHPGMRVLFSSGYSPDAVERSGVLDSSADFLQKPYLMDKLARKVRTLLDEPERMPKRLTTAGLNASTVFGD